MMSRRGLAAGLVAMGALALNGCAPWSLQRRANRAAASVDEVEASELSLGTGGTFQTQMSGEIHCSVGGSELEAVFDQAWEAVVTLLHGTDDGDRQVQGVTATGDDGAVIGPSMWIPSSERNHIVIRDFFERYGLQ